RVIALCDLVMDLARAKLGPIPARCLLTLCSCEARCNLPCCRRDLSPYVLVHLKASVCRERTEDDRWRRRERPDGPRMLGYGDRRARGRDNSHRLDHRGVQGNSQATVLSLIDRRLNSVSPRARY